MDALAALLARPIAHRGLHACGGPGPVENSVSAAAAAVATGYGIECDIQLSADGEAMVFHDAHLDRLTGTAGRVADLEAKHLSSLPLKGGPDTIPTLAEFLAAVDGRAPIVVEIKASAAGDMRLVEQAVRLARGYARPIALESFDPAVVTACRALRAPCPIGLVGPPEDGTDIDKTALDRCDFVSWNIDGVAEIAALRPELARTTWTVRTPIQERAARAVSAQIVFEGFRPLIVP